MYRPISTFVPPEFSIELASVREDMFGEYPLMAQNVTDAAVLSLLSSQATQQQLRTAEALSSISERWSRPLSEYATAQEHASPMMRQNLQEATLSAGEALWGFTKNEQDNKRQLVAAGLAMSLRAARQGLLGDAAGQEPSVDDVLYHANTLSGVLSLCVDAISDSARTESPVLITGHTTSKKVLSRHEMIAVGIPRAPRLAFSPRDSLYYDVPLWNIARIRRNLESSPAPVQTIGQEDDLHVRHIALLLAAPMTGFVRDETQQIVAVEQPVGLSLDEAVAQPRLHVDTIGDGAITSELFDDYMARQAREVWSRHKHTF